MIPVKRFIRRIVYVKSQIGTAAAYAADFPASQAGPPPQSFGGESTGGSFYQIALAVVHSVAVHGRPVLHPPARNIESSANTPAHIAHGRLVVTFDDCTGGCIEQAHTQGFGIVLLDDEMFQPGAVGVDVGQAMSVAVNGVLMAVQNRSVVLEHITSFYKIIASVTVHIGCPDLVKFGLIRPEAVGPVLD